MYSQALPIPRSLRHLRRSSVSRITVAEFSVIGYRWPDDNLNSILATLARYFFDDARHNRVAMYIFPLIVNDNGRLTPPTLKPGSQGCCEPSCKARRPFGLYAYRISDVCLPPPSVGSVKTTTTTTILKQTAVENIFRQQD